MNHDFEEAAANGDDVKAVTSKRLSGRAAGLIAIALLAVLCFIMFAGKKNAPSPMELRQIVMRNQQFNVNRFMLEKLQSNRIVMLADEYHGNYIYLQRLVGFLNYWVDTLRAVGAQNSGLCHKLFLVLEPDSVEFQRDIGLASKGLEGDSIRYWASQYTVETMEYMHDLVALMQRIDSVNAAEGEHRIQFEVFCPESSIVDLTEWTVEKGDDYFINRRDQYSSRKVIDLLEHNPDAKALVYYGSWHFARERTLKTANKMSGYGYYLAHYLVERFGKDGGVYSLDQRVYTQVPATMDFLLASDSTFAISYDPFRQENTALISWSGSMDGIIVDHGRWIDGTPVASVWSKGIAFRSIEHLGDIIDTANNSNSLDWFAVLSGYTVVSGQPISYPHRGDSLGYQKIIRQLSDWRDTVHVDVVRDIESMAIVNRLIDQIPPSSLHKPHWLEGLVGRVARISAPIDTNLALSERVQALRKYAAANRRQIVIDNLIPLLWVGTRDEKMEATEVLKRETGEKFITAKEWTVWWRNNRPLSPSMEISSP